ncbi:MAG: hypothetical protein V7703_20065, partial [Hyphomicrobiales bacterium]
IGGPVDKKRPDQSAHKDQNDECPNEDVYFIQNSAPKVPADDFCTLRRLKSNSTDFLPYPHTNRTDSL